MVWEVKIISRDCISGNVRLVLSHLICIHIIVVLSVNNLYIICSTVEFNCIEMSVPKSLLTLYK